MHELVERLLKGDKRAAAFDFFNSWAGIKHGDRSLGIGLIHSRPATRKAFDLAMRRHHLSVLNINKNNIVQVCSRLAQMKLDVIGGNSLAISWIAMIAKHNGIKIRPKKAVISTQHMLPSRQLLEDAFGCPVFNRYGSFEVGGAIAQNCPGSDKLHVNTELCILEIVDEEGNFCAPGQRGRVVVTDLNNWVMPFIRYDTEDGATAGEPCPCRRTFPVIEHLEPRLAQYIKTPSGNKIASGTLGYLLFIANDYMSYFVKCQAIQTSLNEVTFNFVPLQPVTQGLLSRLSADLRLLLGGEINVEINVVDDIPAAPSGKLEIIKSELEPRAIG